LPASLLASLEAVEALAAHAAD